MAGAFSVAGLKVTVAGAARSGVAAATLLARRGAQVTLSERQPVVPGEAELLAAGVSIERGGHRTETFTGADLVVLSPGVDVLQPFVVAARTAGVPVIGEAELAFRWLKGRVIAITGTKGKSTTTTLTGRMLEASGFRAPVGGNIGVPLSAQVEESTAGTLHVVEMSSFQLETIERFHPWVAALLNFSPDHLDRHPTVEAYAGAKQRVFENQAPDDWCVLSADDRGSAALAEGSRARRRYFGYDGVVDGVTVTDGVVVERSVAGDTPLVRVDALRVPGRHIVRDVMAAATISRIAGATPKAIAAAVEAFSGLEHAMELAGAVGGVRFVNDSKATNVESARWSIESVASDLVVIMGGRYKGGEFRDLRAPLAGRARAVIAIGESAGRIEDALGDAVTVERAGSMDEAVRAAYERARPAGTVVLAPACSSFDMFESYAARGRAFKEAVVRLAQKGRVADEQ